MISPAAQKVKTNGHGLFNEKTFIQLEAHESLGSNKGLPVFTVPVDLCAAGQIQQITGIKIDEQQSRQGVCLDIAKRVEVIVADKIRKRQRAVIIQPYEAWLAATMGYVRTVTGVAGISRIVRGNIEMVR